MFNLFDILESQTGNGMQALGQQFGLSPDQSRRAMEALLPALTIGLQRNVASDPTGFGRLFGLVGAGTPGGGAPFQPAQPDQLLGQLFGSPLLSQAVLQQAAAVSGIATPALRQMLPAMAGMVVAGIVHVMINQPPPAAPAAPPPRRPPEPEPANAFPAAAFWSDWIDGFIAATKPEAPSPPAAKLKDVTPEPTAAAAPPEARPGAGEGKAPAPDAPMESFQKLFETGIEVQEQNVKAMQEIFDSFWSNAGWDQTKGGEAAAPATAPKPEVPPRPTSKPARAGSPRSRTSKPGAEPASKGKPASKRKPD